MTAPTLQFRRATRRALKLKVGIDGPAGAGKTDGMLALLTAIAAGGRIAVADSENESASYYAHRYEFDSVPLDAKSTPKTVMQIIDLAIAEGYTALGIDSLSRVWQNVLNAKEKYERENPTANRFTIWGMEQFGGGWERMMKYMLDAPIHIVATMRSKMAYEQVERNGQKKVEKLGLQAQVRDGAEYEFGVVFSVNMAHRAVASKDRTELFEPDELIDLRDPDLHKKLITWMNTETVATQEEVEQLLELAKHDGVSDIARKEVQKLVGNGMPSADKVQRYTERLRQRISEHEQKAAEAAQETDGAIAASA